MINKIETKGDYNLLIDSIGELLTNARKTAFQQINNILVITYWQIGRHIVEYEQKGNEKADYGSDLLNRLSKDLKIRYGKGFSRRNILDMRRFYSVFENWQTVSAKLSWSHYSLLLSISDDLERSFYEKQCLNEKWSVRELKRQINSALFLRLAISKDKKGILDLSSKGQKFEKHSDIVKDPYIFEFLNIPENYKLSEKNLEQKLIDNLQRFLLELGKGFAFVARQFRITLANEHFYVDLVFYHRILKCFVLIDLKINHIKHHDIGQMNMYLNYFKNEENVADDSNPIGIILTADKDDIMVEYALGGISNKLFVSKYQLYLPDKKQLEAKVRALLGR
ncbi:MAG: PDDEXK nuclease domain-containing protein [FCB group bacterium]|jgi:predicted nuclease of restriction endonuclease-like (RecB) superfamily